MARGKKKERLDCKRGRGAFLRNSGWGRIWNSGHSEDSELAKVYGHLESHTRLAKRQVKPRRNVQGGRIWSVRTDGERAGTSRGAVEKV